MKKIVYFGVLYRKHKLEARVCPTLDKEEAIAAMREEAEISTEEAQWNKSCEFEDKISEYRVEGYAFDEDVDPVEYEYKGYGELKEMPAKVFFQVVRKADEEYIKECEDEIEKREADGWLQRILSDEVYDENGKDISAEDLYEKLFEKAKKHGIDPSTLSYLKKINVVYEQGTDFNGKPIDYMMTLEPISDMVDEDVAIINDVLWDYENNFGRMKQLYSEIPLRDDDFDENGEEKPESDERHYKELKSMVIEKAKKLGINPIHLKFFRD